MALPIRKKSEHDLAKSKHDFAQKNKNKTYFYGSDLVPIYEGCFYYKYRLCIRVNLEIEGAENKGLESNTKTRVCIEFALGNKH